jgi:hypothetical protein
LVASLILAVLPVRAATQFEADILHAHNQLRATFNLPPLIWDEGLAEDAGVWASHLAESGAFAHDRQSTEGENLWRGTAGAYTLEEMVGGWSGEQRLFREGVFPDVSRSGSTWHDVGHFTQMIWKNTTAVGCAIATGHGYDVLVCRYSPPGNVVGERPY